VLFVATVAPQGIGNDSPRLELPKPSVVNEPAKLFYGKHLPAGREQ